MGKESSPSEPVEQPASEHNGTPGQTTVSEQSEPHEQITAHADSVAERPGFNIARRAFAKAGLDWNDDTLRELGMIDEDGEPSNVGRLLGDDCPFEIKALVFTDEAKTRVLERAHFTGSLLRQLDDAMDFITRHDTRHPHWPMQAVREALVNALEHRDYDSFSGPTMVNLYNDKLEIISLGGLVNGLKLNDLINGACEPREPRLASLLEKLGVAENANTGIFRIINAYEHCDVAPRISVGPRSVSLTFPRPVTAKKGGKGKGIQSNLAAFSTTRPIDPDHPNVYAFPPRNLTHDPALALAGGVRVVGAFPVESVPLTRRAWSVETLPQDVEETLEEMILHFMERRGAPLSMDIIRRSVQRPEGEVRRALATLEEAELVKRIGRSRSTKYMLTK